MDHSNKKETKMIAPIIITVIIVGYYLLYFGIIMYLVNNMLVNILLAVIPLALAGVMIYVCVERIKEIRSGEEDDLSEY